MAKVKSKSRFPFDGGLLLLLAVSSFSSIYTLRKFSNYQDTVDSTMRSNLETLRDEHRRSLDELRSIVNSGISHSLPGNQLSSTNKISINSSSSSFSNSVSAPRSVFRSLPSGLSLIRCGDWYVSDGLWKYGLGDMSPVGLITNITRGVVMTDIDTFSYCNAPLRFPVASNSDKKGGGSYD